MRASAHLRACQEIAFAHSAAVGFPLGWYEAHRRFWVLRRIRFVVRGEARYGDALTYTTRVVGARRVLARRRTTVVRGDGASIATCVADWIFTRDGAEAVRIADELVAAFPAFATPIAPMPLDDPAPPEDAHRESVRLRTTDLDDMRHANHTVYVDLIDDAVARAGGVDSTTAYPRTYDLLYHAAAAAHDPLSDAVWRAPGAWHYRLARADGAPIMHGRLTPEEPPDG
jgi:acyl-ACP thioesterase